VQLLQQPGERGVVLVVEGLDDLLEHLLDVRVPRPQPFGVEHAESAERADLDRDRRRDDRVGGVGQQGDVETVGVDLPCRRDVLGRAGAAGRDDLHLVQRVAAPGRPAHADLDKIPHWGSFPRF
jgi:hypothetical protein